MSVPVVIADYDPRWPRRFAEERARILEAIGAHVEGVEHVGSTAVPGLAAKPTLDIMVGVRNLDLAPRCIPRLESLGYEYVPAYEALLPERRYFRRGPPERRAVHLHMVEVASDFWRDHLLFRDCLRTHPRRAREYARLKRRLAAVHRHDREGYTEAKSDFIQRVLRQAGRETRG